MEFSATPRVSDVAIGSVINGVINGLISWSGFKDTESVPLSMDSIGYTGISALGNAAMVVFALTLILSCITFFTYRSAARKAELASKALQELNFFPAGLRIAISTNLLAFGAFVAAAVIWQRFAGTFHVGPLAATLVVASVAVVAAGFTQLRAQNLMQAEVRRVSREG